MIKDNHCIVSFSGACIVRDERNECPLPPNIFFFSVYHDALRSCYDTVFPQISFFQFITTLLGVVMILCSLKYLFCLMWRLLGIFLIVAFCLADMFWYVHPCQKLSLPSCCPLDDFHIRLKLRIGETKSLKVIVSHLQRNHVCIVKAFAVDQRSLYWILEESV